MVTIYYNLFYLKKLKGEYAMGGAQSRVENMGSNKLLQRLASPEHISVDDVFWNRLLLFERRPFTL